MGRRNESLNLVRESFVLWWLVPLGALVLPGCGGGARAEMQHLRSLNNHRKHVDLNMECTGCHTGARDENHAHLPSINACAQCHRTDRPSPKTSEELAGYIKRREEIPWVRVNRLPGHVYFSHLVHVKLGEIECGECHGDMKNPDHPVTRPLVRAPDMYACIDCHKRHGASVDCLTCHR